MAMRSLINSINQSANDWNVPQRVAWWIIAVPIIGAVFVGLSRISLSFYTFLTMEDGPLEWSQFILYAAAAILGCGVAIKRFQAGHPWQALMFLGFGLANLFIAGEEIAWGQRIFGLRTPDELMKLNHQGEITIHNIMVIQNAFNIVLLVGSAFCMAMYFINKKYHFEKKWDQANYLFVPPLFSASLFFVMLAYKLIRFVVFPTAEFTITKYGEWPELCFAFGLFLFAWLNYRRLAVPQRAMNSTAQQQRHALK